MRRIVYGTIFLCLSVTVGAAMETQIGKRILIAFVEGALLIPAVLRVTGTAVIDLRRIYEDVRQELSKEKDTESG